MLTCLQNRIDDVIHVIHAKAKADPKLNFTAATFDAVAVLDAAVVVLPCEKNNKMLHTDPRTLLE